MPCESMRRVTIPTVMRWMSMAGSTAARCRRSVYLDEQLHVGQLSQQDAHQAVGQMCVTGQAVCCEGLEARGKMFADTAHEQQDERVAITSAQLVADALEGIVCKR